MNKYVIITPNITEIGGAQMYIRNKCIFLKERGYKVDVISAVRGKIIIEELKEFTNNIFTHILFSCCDYTKHKRKVVMNKILGIIQDAEYENIYIESTGTAVATWSELIAKECSAKHIFYCLQENEQISKISHEFVVFKHNRHELAGIKRNSVYRMMSSFHPIELEDSHFLPAYCTNTYDNTEFHLYDNSIHNFSHRIGLLSNLDKPFVNSAIKGVLEYAKMNTNKTFFFILIGGSDNMIQIKRRLKRMIKGIQNIHVEITGYIFPIPISLLCKCDVLISSAGSASICEKSGVPTVSYDAIDHLPIGFYRRTTYSNIYRNNNEPAIPLRALLDKVLKTKEIMRYDPASEDIIIDFSSHMNFLGQMSADKKYYNFKQINRTVKDKVRFIMLMFNPNIYIFVNKIFSILRR